MHQCDEFRERITEHIIDRKDCSAGAEFRRELLACSECSEFYTESREMIEAISSVDFAISEDQWNAMAGRLRSQLQAEAAVAALNDRPRSRAWRASRRWRELLAVAALLLVTVGLYRAGAPRESAAPANAEYVYVDHSTPLDPVTVDFLEESELLLRNVMKIAPSDAEDLADAKRVAARQLAGIEQRKAAAAEVPPAVNVMDT